ncbi:uncharacterized protein [Heptranchias perlo]
MQRDSAFLRLWEQFGLIAILQIQKLNSWFSFVAFILLAYIAAPTKIAAAETIIQEKTYPIIHIGNECSIDIKNISCGCTVGWQEEKEWHADNRPIALLEQGKPLHCIEPCINLQQHKIWIDCSSMKYIIKYTCRCVKENQVKEAYFLFKYIQEPVSSFPKLTALTPESKTPKLELEKQKHIGAAMSLGIVALAVLFIYLKRQCRKTRRAAETDDSTSL